MRVIRFSGRFDDWRRESRRLLESAVAPHLVNWQADDGPADLFGDTPDIGNAARPPSRRLSIPRELPELLEAASRYRADDRWALLYRVLWRVVRGERSAMLAGDPDGSELQRRAKAVRREAHHMHAFLRFRQRPVEAGSLLDDPRLGGLHSDSPRYVAWHEPAHDVLEDAARHFQGRMGRTSWLIATPDGAALCDGDRIRMLHPCPSELAQLARATEDADGDALWRAYYASTFNPTRLNEKVMRGHMPARFWKHLPEGPLIATLGSRARAGQQRLAQTAEVGAQPGKPVLIAREQAQPQRPLPNALEDCRACEIWRDATRAVAGEGQPGARILLLAEQPGDQEDLAGRPFVGPAGALLDALLADVGLDRAALYVTNAVKHFKWEPRSGPLGRSATRKHATPKPAEIRACHGWLARELQTLQPTVIVALGRTALASLLRLHDPQRVRLADYAGRTLRHDGRWLLVAPHPAAILRSEGTRQAEWRMQLREALRQAGALRDRTSAEP